MIFLELQTNVCENFSVSIFPVIVPSFLHPGLLIPFSALDKTKSVLAHPLSFPFSDCMYYFRSYVWLFFVLLNTFC